MDYNGDASKVFTYEYDYAAGDVDDVTFSVSKTNTKVSNHLEYADFNYYKKDAVTELSRFDWDRTYPISYVDLEVPASLIDHLNGKYYTVSTTDDTSSVIWDSKDTDYTISDMKLADYNDPRWNDLLNQLSMEEAMGVVACGGNQFRAMESVGFVKGNYSENSGNGVALSIKNSTVTAD
jgi:beta-glucosidase